VAALSAATASEVAAAIGGERAQAPPEWARRGGARPLPGMVAAAATTAAAAADRFPYLKAGGLKPRIVDLI